MPRTSSLIGFHMPIDLCFHSARPLIMGILNVTPDSFSDGGAHADPEAAARRAEQMVEQGADLIDVGGESTRPGAPRVPAERQLMRVLPVLQRLRRRLPPEVVISIDTTRSDVAAAALSAGATLVNDVSAGRDDPRMFDLVARHGAGLALMHMRGTPETMQEDPRYDDVVAEVLTFLIGRAEQAVRAGIARKRLLIDPGIGFGKRKQDNLVLLAHLDRFVASGYPVLLGTSRKRFMGAVCGQSQPGELVAATAATTALGVMAGVRVFRVHDVMENRQAADVAAAIRDYAS